MDGTGDAPMTTLPRHHRGTERQRSLGHHVARTPISTHLEDEEGGGGSLPEELQEVGHHHLGAVGAVALLGRPQVALLLVAAPGLEVAHGVADGEGHRQEALLLLAVEDVADLLELEGQDRLATVVLEGRRTHGEHNSGEGEMRAAFSSDVKLFASNNNNNIVCKNEGLMKLLLIQIINIKIT